LNNKGLHEFYSSPDISRMVKIRNTGWAGQMALMGRGGEIRIKIWWENTMNRPLTKPRTTVDDEFRINIKK
jgi:hypothetical protein